jgi:peptidyl-tRNA hydrolase
MPLYLDVHTIAGGVAAADVEQAHAADLAHQDKHDTRYLRYWVDEAQGKVFCLVEAPSAEAATLVHKEAHGLVADELFEVQEGA